MQSLDLKKISIVVVSLLIFSISLLFVMKVIFGDSKKEITGKNKQDQKTQEATSKEAKKIATDGVGAVQEVDARGMKIKANQDVISLTFDKLTVVTVSVSGKMATKGSVSDIKTGDFVDVIYGNGTNVAKIVKIKR